MRQLFSCFVIFSILLAAPFVSAAPPPATVKQLTLHDNCWNADWSPDGQWIVYQRSLKTNGNSGSTIWKIKVDGSGETQLTQKSAQTYYCDSKPQWSPDGKWIAFQRNELDPAASRSDDHRTSIWKVNSAGTLESRVVKYEEWDFNGDDKNEGSGAQSPYWSPDGKWIAFRYGGGGFDDYYSSLNVIHPDGTGKKRVTQAWFGYGPKEADFQWKPAGTGLNVKILSSLMNPIYSNQGPDYNGDRNIALIDRNAPAVNKWLTNGYGSTCQLQASWKPNGAKIVYIDDTYGYGDIWTMSPNGSGKTRLTSSIIDADLLDVNWVCYSHPTYRPDGRKIAFFQRLEGSPTKRYIGMMNENGTGKVRLTGDLTDFQGSSEGGAWLLSFNKLGNKLLFENHDVGGNHQIWIATITATE